MLILGIDPGATGALALIMGTSGNCGALKDLAPSPAVVAVSVKAMLFMASRSGDPITAVLEKAQPMPRQGVVSVFGYGKTCGVIEGVLACLEIPYRYTAPGKWKRDLGLIREKNEEMPAFKRRSLDMARRLFPDQELHLQKHHNRAEALLIAEWARRFLFNKETN